MCTIDEKELECGCCIELEVSDGTNKIKLLCHNIAEGLEEAKKLLQINRSAFFNNIS